MVDFLKPINDPNHTFGTDSIQYISNNTTIVGNGTAADDYSNQLAKLIIKQIMNTKQGKSIEVSIVHNSQSAP